MKKTNDNSDKSKSNKGEPDINDSKAELQPIPIDNKSLKMDKTDKKVTAKSELREWKILKMIPRHPNTITASVILERLKSHPGNKELSLRTIQRDLNDLSENWPITNDEKKPLGWFFPKECKIIEIPNMDNQTAITFMVVKEFLSGMLPTSVVNVIKPHIEYAEQILKEKNKKLNPIADKIKIIPGTILLPPKIDSEILNTIYSGLLKEQAIQVKYKRAAWKKASEYIVFPLGLIFKENIIYFVCRFKGQDTNKHLLLHCIKEAKLVNEPKTFTITENTINELKNENFDEKYINHLSFLKDKPLLEFDFMNKLSKIKIHDGKEEEKLSKDDKKQIIRHTEEPFKFFEPFDLDEHVNKGDMNYILNKEEISLKLLFNKNAGEFLNEIPLSKGQKLTKTEDEQILLETEILDSMQLRIWILMQGDRVKVLEPEYLKDEFKKIAQNIVKNTRIRREGDNESPTC